MLFKVIMMIIWNSRWANKPCASDHARPLNAMRILPWALLLGLFSGCGDDSNPGGGQASTSGTAILTWVAPTVNEDDSPASLSGFNIYQGLSAAELTQIATVDATTLTYTASGLAANNTYYFAVKAVGTNGLESAYSDIASKTIP